MMYRLTRSLSCGLAFLAFCPGRSHADDSASRLAEYSLDELMQVQIASLFKEDELSVGSTVSKITEEDWRVQGAQKTFDALLYVPGIYLSEYFHGQKVPLFRGFARPEQYNSFLLLLDGIPLNNYSSSGGTYATPNYALGNLQSIEVIRGPGSSLYGADAFNGVVSLNSWSSDHDITELWGEGGTHGYQSGTARFRKTLAEGATLTSMFSGSAIHDEELAFPFHPSGGGSVMKGDVSGRYENFTTTHKLSVQNLEAALYYSRHNVVDGFGPGELTPVFPNGVHTDGEAEISALKVSHSLELDKGFNLETMVYHVQDELIGSFGTGANVGEPPTSRGFIWDSEDSRIGGHVRLLKPLDDAGSQMVFGYNYDELEVDHLQIGSPDSALIAHETKRRVNGVMGQVEQRFFDNQFQLIAGVRHDDYSDSGGHTSPRVAAIYHPTEKSALKFLFGNAYRTPSVNEQSDNGAVKGGGPGLKPEQVDTFEVAWIQSSESWRYRLSTYYSEVTDSIGVFGSEDPNFGAEYKNIVDAESKGVELEGIMKLEDWNVFGHVAWNEAEQTNPVNDPQAYLPYPDFIFGSGVSWAFCPQATISFHQILYDGFQQRYTGPIVSPAHVPQDPYNTYYRADLHLSWQPATFQSDCELYFTVYDIFDRADPLATMVSTEFGSGTTGLKAAAGVRLWF
jgi:iron complex outermembrane receptor protein